MTETGLQKVGYHPNQSPTQPGLSSKTQKIFRLYLPESRICKYQGDIRSKEADAGSRLISNVIKRARAAGAAHKIIPMH